MTIVGRTPYPDPLGGLEQARARQAGEATRQSAASGEAGAAQSSTEASNASDVSSTTLAILRASTAGAEEIRHDRVEAIRLAIAEGRYNVANEDIADALMREQLS